MDQASKGNAQTCFAMLQSPHAVGQDLHASEQSQGKSDWYLYSGPLEKQPQSYQYSCR